MRGKEKSMDIQERIRIYLAEKELQRKGVKK